MGVNTHIDLKQLKQFFPSYNFTHIQATKDGVVDTTYIVSNAQQSYILKHFDRDVSSKITTDKKLLKHLHNEGLNVSSYLSEKNGWYLYTKLLGTTPKVIKLFHIQALARFMAKYHHHTYQCQCSSEFVQNYPVDTILRYTKQHFYRHYKELATLKKYRAVNDGFIHGDIFKDNTVFDGEKIGVFDFIDGGCGEFAFDIAVALLSFTPTKKRLYIQTFLQTYNQKAPKKLSFKKVEEKLTIASKLYALLRIERYKNTKKANELIFR